MAKPQRQTGAPTADVLAVIRLTAVQPRLRGRGFETAEPAADRARFDVALVAAPLTTVVRSKTDVEAAGAVVTITPAAMQALDAIRPAGVGGEVQVFGLSESQIARWVKVIAKAAGLTDWEYFSGHRGRVGMTRRMAQNGAPTHQIERPGRWKQSGGIKNAIGGGSATGIAGDNRACQKEAMALKFSRGWRAWDDVVRLPYSWRSHQLMQHKSRPSWATRPAIAVLHSAVTNRDCR